MSATCSAPSAGQDTERLREQIAAEFRRGYGRALA